MGITLAIANQRRTRNVKRTIKHYTLVESFAIAILDMLINAICALRYVVHILLLLSH